MNDSHRPLGSPLSDGPDDAKLPWLTVPVGLALGWWAPGWRTGTVAALAWAALLAVAFWLRPARRRFRLIWPAPRHRLGVGPGGTYFLSFLVPGALQTLAAAVLGAAARAGLR